jgi:hypothetical protein
VGVGSEHNRKSWQSKSEKIPVARVWAGTRDATVAVMASRL